MKAVLRYFTTVRREMWVFLAVCVGVYFGLDGDQPLLQSLKLSAFVSNIAASGIAGFVFYFIDVHIRTEKELRRARPLIAHHLGRMVMAYAEFLGPVREAIKEEPFMVFDTEQYSITGFQKAIATRYGTIHSSELRMHLRRLQTRLSAEATALLHSNVLLPDAVQTDAMYISSTAQTFLTVSESEQGWIESSTDGLYIAMCTAYCSVVQQWLGEYIHPLLVRKKWKLKLFGYPQIQTPDAPLIRLFNDPVIARFRQHPMGARLGGWLRRSQFEKQWK
ncbi:MAG: hypothetical protein IPK70_06625 [Flavobacteriales bacterium]|nr:hypothetical protein [Flavobacteriales bacterium]